MHHRAEYLLQVLEKIGAPLMASVITVNARSNDGQLHNEAQKIAELLNKAVHVSIDMSHSLDLGPTGEMTDSIRIALTGLAGPLVAGAFRTNGKSPTDPEMKRVIAALQAVLTFAENFEANSENSDRLKNISADGQQTDPAQNYVQYINAFTPVINAAGVFSFGQPEQKLLMDISSRLTARAQQMRERLFGDAGADNRRTELGILKALAEIFVACHEAETIRIQALNDDARAQMQTADGISQETLWKNFDVRATMLEVLSQGIAANTPLQGSAGGGVKPQPAAPQQAAVLPPVQQQQGNPMAMFKKPDAAPPANEPVELPQQQAVGQNIPPQNTPPAAPAGGASPMSFFKTPPKDS